MIVECICRKSHLLQLLSKHSMQSPSITGRTWRNKLHPHSHTQLLTPFPSHWPLYCTFHPRACIFKTTVAICTGTRKRQIVPAFRRCVHGVGGGETKSRQLVPAFYRCVRGLDGGNSFKPFTVVHQFRSASSVGKDTVSIFEMRKVWFFSTRGKQQMPTVVSKRWRSLQVVFSKFVHQRIWKPLLLYTSLNISLTIWLDGLATSATQSRSCVFNLFGSLK